MSWFQYMEVSFGGPKQQITIVIVILYIIQLHVLLMST